MSFVKLQPPILLPVPANILPFNEAALVVENSAIHPGSVYIRAGYRGYHVPNADAEKFARAILESIEDPTNQPPKERTRVLTVVAADGTSYQFTNPQSHKETQS